MKINAPKPWPLVPIAAVVITPVPEVNVRAILSPVRGAAKVSALFAVLEPPDVLMVVAALSTMLELDAPMVVGPLLVNAPAKLMLLGAVAVKPALKVNVSAAASPKVKDPVLANVEELAMVVVEPVNAKSYAPDPVLIDWVPT